MMEQKKRQIQLKQGHIVKIKPMIWVKVYLKKNQIVCVICDKKYSLKEYIRNYKVFKKINISIIFFSEIVKTPKDPVFSKIV